MTLSYCDTYDSSSNDILDINFRCLQVDMGKLRKGAFTLRGTIMYYFEQDVFSNTIYEEYRDERKSKAMFVCYSFHLSAFTMYFDTQDIRGY